jgi:hypothetical protein
LYLAIQARVTSSAMKQQRDGAGSSTSDLRDSLYDGAIRDKLGEALGARHDLREPLPQGLVELLGRLDASVCARENAGARFYAEIDECVAAMVCAANKKPGEPGQA